MQKETIDSTINRGMPFGKFVATATKSAAMGFSGIVGGGFNLIGDGFKAATGLAKSSVIEGMELERGKKSKMELFKSDAKKTTISSLYSLGITGGLYGLSALMGDDKTNTGGERLAHYGRHAIAAGVDTASDVGLGVIGLGLSTLGPYGALAGTALNMFNMGAGFLGMDAGSLAMNFMNMADEEYDKRTQGSKFEMTANTSMTMQRQIQNLHANGSNLGEMMHN